jgi:uncharacterized YigZ family protein
MQATYHYTTIEKSVTAEFKDRGSRFIAFAYPIQSADAFKKIITQLKKEHPKAVHHCFAYKLGTDGHQYRVSDDGEPSGTAGKPILNVIESKQLTNILIVVVRYFGGTLLGVPGLINAYKSAASMTLQIVPFIQKAIEIPYELHFDYTKLNEVMTLIKQHNCTVLAQENQLFCMLQIGIPKANEPILIQKLNTLYPIEIKKMPLA